MSTLPKSAPSPASQFAFATAAARWFAGAGASHHSPRCGRPRSIRARGRLVRVSAPGRVVYRVTGARATTAAFLRAVGAGDFELLAFSQHAKDEERHDSAD